MGKHKRRRRSSSSDSSSSSSSDSDRKQLKKEKKLIKKEKKRLKKEARKERKASRRDDAKKFPAARPTTPRSAPAPPLAARPPLSLASVLSPLSTGYTEDRAGAAAGSGWSHRNERKKDADAGQPLSARAQRHRDELAPADTALAVAAREADRDR